MTYNSATDKPWTVEKWAICWLQFAGNPISGLKVVEQWCEAVNDRGNKYNPELKAAVSELLTAARKVRKLM